MQLDIPTDTVIDESVVALDDFNLGKEIAKDLTISAAQTAGLVAGFVVVAFALDAGTKIHKRFFKKAKPELYVVTDLPEAAEK